MGKKIGRRLNYPKITLARYRLMGESPCPHVGLPTPSVFIDVHPSGFAVNLPMGAFRQYFHRSQSTNDAGSVVAP
jgi:hypothetical protein